ncbi:hypothetical protein TTHT_0961 [Thermotomaculum hydrothermale]|uniref:Uncharacterized protein n=1 Tax=Thermotomaculum hydrothermale TaxID=981385 RepID=A0A7R6PH57_9BACT|nr:hypothetical protein [Thermotomaculum hydrothermale]BBB32514.1 hypothetical protein TTHT_0961 [Thermotomaculum hydrothermale]
MKKIFNQVEAHNYIDIVAGSLMLIFMSLFGLAGFAFFSLIALHVFVKKAGDERERMLYAKANMYAFHCLIGILAVLSFCCKGMVDPLFLIGIAIFLRGFVGAIIFALG